jgi:hypothetical protein
MDDTYEAMLERVIHRTRERSPELAELIQQAVDEGKSVQTARPFDGAKRGKTHTYESRVPLNPREALEKVIFVFQTHLVEMPMCISSMSTELTQTKVGGAAALDTGKYPLFGQADSKTEATNVDTKSDTFSATIDLAHEGKQTRNNQDTQLLLTPLSADEIKKQQLNLEELRSILLREQ